MIKKIVISPSNKAAIGFFDEMAKRKTVLKKKIEEKAAKRMSGHTPKKADA